MKLFILLVLAFVQIHALPVSFADFKKAIAGNDILSQLTSKDSDDDLKKIQEQFKLEDLIKLADKLKGQDIAKIAEGFNAGELGKLLDKFDIKKIQESVKPDLSKVGDVSQLMDQLKLQELMKNPMAGLGQQMGQFSNPQQMIDSLPFLGSGHGKSIFEQIGGMIPLPFVPEISTFVGNVANGFTSMVNSFMPTSFKSYLQNFGFSRDVGAGAGTSAGPAGLGNGFGNLLSGSRA